MEFGVCASPQQSAGLELSGIDFLEGNVQDLLAPRADEAAWAVNAELMRGCGRAMPVLNCFLPGDLKCTGPVVDDAALDAYARTAFIRAKEAGVGMLVFGSGKSRELVEGWSRAEAERQIVAMLKRFGRFAGEQGVTLLVEPIHSPECNFINTLAEGAAVVEAVGESSVLLLADFYHMLRQGEGPEELRKYGRWIAHVHVAEKAQRTAPGVAGDDFRPYLRVLKEIGYDGMISLECGWQDFGRQAEAAVAELRRQWLEA